MEIGSHARMLVWTHHSRAKMGFYRLSQGRVRRVLHSPKRVEEGVAPKTVAMMQPTALKTATTWTQEIWVMVRDAGSKRKVISAWRYPGMTKPRAVLAMAQKEFREYAVADKKSAHEEVRLADSEFLTRPVTKAKRRRLYSR